MKKVLIITYYWIPSGGAGVQRWVKFAKYLRNFGWEPVIYAPENPEYPSEDHSFVKDIPNDVVVIKKPIWEPYNIYRNILGKKGEKINAGFISENKKAGWKEKLSIWIRGNLLIPDPRRFWIRPSVKFLSNYIVDNKIDAVITTGPPHSMHLIGLRLKKQLPKLKWIADFRDPWTNIDFYADLNLTWVADKLHRHLERKVIQNADNVLVVSNGMRDEFELMQPHKLDIITNGYDNEDKSTTVISLDEKFSLAHIGTLNAARNPIILWKVLGEICKENALFKSDLIIRLVGKTDYTVFEEIDKNNLSANLEKLSYVTHNEAIELQQKSQILLLLINNTNNAKGILTGKFFEYLAAKRPVLAVGPVDGDVAKVLKDTAAGKMVDFDDMVATKNVILYYYQKYKEGKLNVNSTSIEKYSRRSLTAQLVAILNS